MQTPFELGQPATRSEGVKRLADGEDGSLRTGLKNPCLRTLPDPRPAATQETDAKRLANEGDESLRTGQNNLCVQTPIDP